MRSLPRRAAHMFVLQLVPVVVSLLVLGAHFLRAGNAVMVAVVLSLPLLLLVRRRWAARVVQAALLLGAAEWVWTAVQLAAWRARAGQPMLRMAAVLCAVTMVTALSALVFRTRRLRHRYGGERFRLPGRE